ncbi:MAG TPA: hypothetical protein VLY20_06275 [Nitrospiria bacterium]|nr:hypothetical protein [Nitrospiria bacterium]
MQVEIYQREMVESAAPDFLDAFEEWEHRASLVKELGLSGQQRYMDGLGKAKDIPFKLLSPDECMVWRSYLGKRYLEDRELSEERNLNRILGLEMHRLTEYAHDLIPLTALKTWADCKEMGYFDSYQIWTAERRSDPILLGQVGPLLFLIARWGESLKPVEEIEREVQEQRRR